VVSQRYLDFRKWLKNLWTRLLRYWLIIWAFGMLIGYVVEYSRIRYGTFVFFWILVSLSITYILFFIFYKPARDMDGDV
jgi:hypothetical protein